MSWISRAAALEVLGVKPQTLYAYVSRGHVASRPSPHDARASEFSEADIRALRKRRTAGRARKAVAAGAIAWGDPVLETRITAVRDGRLFYRGRDAVALAETASLEDVAAILWEHDRPEPAPSAPPPVEGALARSRALTFLAQRTAEAPPSFGRSAAALAAEGWGLMDGFMAALVGDEASGPAHRRLAQFWTDAETPAVAEALRRALVLVADHELNASTFAARVAASTGASLAAAALAGFAALTGPLHGAAPAKALDLLKRAAEIGDEAALAEVAARGERIPGLGHALYPAGDPRAASLLASCLAGSWSSRFIAKAEQAAGKPANIDFALAAITFEHGLPAEAPFLVFAVGRMAGWIAHAIEQAETGRLIRPRANYIGSIPTATV